MISAIRRLRNSITDGDAAAVLRKYAAFIPLALAVFVAGAVLLPKLSHGYTRTYIKNSGSSYETVSYCSDAGAIIAEQRAKLHPFDMITYAGYGDDGSFIIEVQKAPCVTVYHDGRMENVYAVIGETVSALLSREGYDVGEYDSVSPSKDTLLTEDCFVRITRAFPVSVTADGKTLKTTAAGITVGELLVREGYSLSADDELNCGINDEVYENMSVVLHRVTFSERTRLETVPYSTMHVMSTLFVQGEEVVVTKGVNGEKIMTYTEKYIDGIKVSETLKETKLIPAVTEVTAHGTALGTPYSKAEGELVLRDGIPTHYDYTLEGKVTAYTAPEGSGTYSGRPLVIGSASVDPDKIPFGSVI